MFNSSLFPNSLGILYLYVYSYWTITEMGEISNRDTFIVFIVMWLFSKLWRKPVLVNRILEENSLFVWNYVAAKTESCTMLSIGNIACSSGTEGSHKSPICWGKCYQLLSHALDI